MGLTVFEWHERAQCLRVAGLDALADFYAENAKRAARGERPVWPIPAELLVSRHLAGKPEPPAPIPFVEDGREPAHDRRAAEGRS